MLNKKIEEEDSSSKVVVVEAVVNNSKAEDIRLKHRVTNNHLGINRMIIDSSLAVMEEVVAAVDKAKVMMVADEYKVDGHKEVT